MATTGSAIDYHRIAEAEGGAWGGKFFAAYRVSDGQEIIGESPALKAALEHVEIVAPTDSTVLILGETGTGKELIARAIHNLSPRRDRIFVSANCASIPAGLLESELFGHEKGAFTGAIAREIGRFELANKGTLFLDEVGDIPLELHPKLLRVTGARIRETWQHADYSRGLSTGGRDQSGPDSDGRERPIS